MSKIQSRRDFLRLAGLGITSLAAQQLLGACGVKPTTQSQTVNNSGASDPAVTQSPELSSPTPSVDHPYLVVARGIDPEEMVKQGINTLGGMSRFMKPNADVIIKPNICVGYNTYEYASTTNPWVVGALVKLCLEAGARRVRVMDYGFSGAGEQAYRMSGIGDQVTAAGGEMEVMSQLKFAETAIPDGVRLKQVNIYQDILTADLLINVPIAKNHSMAKLTLGLKNLMGVMTNRESIHPSFKDNLIDLATVVRPHLTIVDAIRTLMANGPTGGNLGDVKQQDTLIFSPDIVAADSYATRLFDMTPQDIPYILSAAERGLGKYDLSGLKIQEIQTNV